MTEILLPDLTTKVWERMLIKEGDIFRGHCPGEGTGPWMVAKSDAYRTEKGIHIKADFYQGKVPVEGEA